MNLYHCWTCLTESGTNHTTFAQYRAPSASEWSSFSNISYNSTCQCWSTIFATLTTTELGDYDIRLKVQDTDNGTSSWYTYDDIIEVQNNNPSLVNYTLSSDQVQTIFHSFFVG